MKQFVKKIILICPSNILNVYASQYYGDVIALFMGHSSTFLQRGS